MSKENDLMSSSSMQKKGGHGDARTRQRKMGQEQEGGVQKL